MKNGDKQRAKMLASGPPSNPATFSVEVIDAIRLIVEAEAVSRRGLSILDPFAGTGGIHALASNTKGARISTTGVELESEWADQHEDTVIGNALHLPWRANRFDAIVTSPVYGNRMSDHHDAKERCKECKAKGFVWIDPNRAAVLRETNDPDYEIRRMVIDRKTIAFGTCEKCGGTGRRNYKRNTYTHHLGRDLSDDSSGVLQWGSPREIAAYQDFHREAWIEASRVARDLFIINIKNHIRKGIEMPVAQWHVECLKGIGWDVDVRVEVKTPGLGFGANREARTDCEYVIVLRR